MMKYLSLFSGIGGFEVGILNSQYGDKLECIGYAEIDKYADSIYRKRFPEHKALGDVTKLKTSDLPDFDLLVGGFPCQAFSIAGKRRGFDDTRGTLFFEIARILKDKRPRYFLLENVKGLLSHDKGKTFKTILEVLSDLRYDVTWEVLNSKNHGVPQNRERIFIKGYFRGECGSEVLSFSRENETFDGKITAEMNKGRSCKVVDTDGIIGALTAGGHNSGGRSIIVTDIKQPVFKRKYDVDIPNLQTLLRTSKQEQGLSNKDLAEKLDVPLTTVEHWFRTDKSFSIPSKEIWFDLKQALNITDDSFDASITEFVEMDSKFDMSNRLYDDNGLSPTLKSSTDGELIKEHQHCIEDYNGEIKKVGNVSPTNHWRSDVLSSDGISKALTTSDYKDPVKIIEDYDGEIKKVGNFSRTNHHGANIYDEDGISPTLVSGSVVKNGLHVVTEKQQERKLIKLNNKSQAQTIYSADGLSCTLSANGGGDGGKTGLYAVPDNSESERKLIQLNDQPESQSERIYSTDGLARTLSSGGGGGYVKTGLYAIPDDFEKIDDDTYMTTTKNGDAFALTTVGNRGMPLKKKQDNYVLEKCIGGTQPHAGVTDGTYTPTLTCTRNNLPHIVQKKVDDYELEECIGSTQKNAAKTDGTYSPTLTCAMGNGGGHVPMLKFSKEKKSVYQPLLAKNKPVKITTATKKGYDEAYPNDGVRLDHPGSNTGRGRVQQDSTGALTCNGQWGTLTNDYKVRRLTPLECERLQGFPDNWTKYGADDEIISDTQRYKCCGNAVTTNVITYIFNNWELNP